MSRVLRRPMFRGGGKIDSRGTGITSGLEDRKGFQTGGIDLEQVKSGSEELFDLQKQMGLFDRPERKTLFGLGTPEFLALAQRGFEFATKGGDETLGQKFAGTAADTLGDIGAIKSKQRERTQKLDEQERAIKAANVGSVYDQLGQEVLAKIKAEGASKDKIFAQERDIELIKQYSDELFDVQDGIKKIKEKYSKDVAESDYSEEDRKNLLDLYRQASTTTKILSDLVKIDPVTEAAIDNQLTFATLYDTFSARIAPTIPVDDPGHATAVIAAIKRELGLSLKDGGRVKKQLGGTVEKVETEDASIKTKPGSDVYELTYEQLRARLPREITDDIVLLLSSSMEALTNFAEIQSQEDVNNFNRMYNVNLVLPSEA